VYLENLHFIDARINSKGLFANTGQQSFQPFSGKTNFSLSAYMGSLRSFFKT
jgi:hypothetical protein